MNLSTEGRLDRAFGILVCGASLDIRDPAAGHLLVQVPAMDGVGTHRAIETAEAVCP
ncbi:hypothetical protein [Pseudomonas abietaniphila]|uniref:hypothetical protein n=1 Tax=Pseudomonas abietaniphila TaxID=89065 RepID=UPI000AD81C10|nr:hypothetical protein [Pseudomonas abietaniphila]